MLTSQGPSAKREKYVNKVQEKRLAFNLFLFEPRNHHLSHQAVKDTIVETTF